MAQIEQESPIVASGWAPPPRPRWVELLNRLGSNFIEPSAFVALDEASLLATAERVTGLNDYGPDDAWRKPFRLLLDDMENEGDLTLTGRLITRYDLLRSLVFRLRMAEAEKQHPEILDEQIEAPIFVTGLGRTGTSILHEALAQDPRLRAPLGWEMRYPPVASDERRSEMTADEIDLWMEVVPEFVPIHEISVNGPEEDSVGLEHEFTSQAWGGTNRVPTFDMWMATEGWGQAFAFQRRLLQHLQFGQPKRRWLLKGIYASCLVDVFKEFPDATVVMTHRDPVTVLASMANMLGTLRWQRTDSVDYQEIVAPLSFGIPFILQMVVDQRTSGDLPDDRCIDVRFADLMADELGTIGKIYDQLGVPLTDDAAARIRQYLTDKPRGRHGAHTYRIEDLGLDRAKMRTSLAGYMKYFDIPEEQQ